MNHDLRKTKFTSVQPACFSPDDIFHRLATVAALPQSTHRQTHRPQKKATALIPTAIPLLTLTAIPIPMPSLIVSLDIHLLNGAEGPHGDIIDISDVREIGFEINTGPRLEDW